MDVVWIIHNPFVEVLRHCIDRVGQAGASQRVVSLRDYAVINDAERVEYVERPILEAYGTQPAIIVWCLHVGNPDVYPHYQNSPAQLNIIIEHDLFCTHPEGGVATPKPTELLLFTRQHWMCRHEYQDPQRRFTPARWYKLDGYLREDAQAFLRSEAYAGHDRWQYGMLVDSLVYAPGPFTKSGPFKAVYEKPWKQPAHREGTVAAPVNLCGPAGVISAQYLAGFWISRKSSILAEAVFHGCIPVIHQQPEIEQEECAKFYLQETPTALYPLSQVRIDKHNPTGGQFITAKAVTTTGDFEDKIRILQQDPELRAAVVKEIARQWMFGPVDETPLPTVDDIVLERLKEFGWTP
ncbi:MAG: hypothetical protein HYV26_20270 [Candidatus Hydrogenedentes bacterium]|nr:hypothetical protein [Candidatus Hydrogenedentota bacterium]